MTEKQPATNFYPAGDDLQEIIKNSEKILKDNVKWKNKRYKDKKTGEWIDLWLAYIDARALENFLDENIGAENWQNEYIDARGVLICRLGIRTKSGWLWKSNAGSDSQIEAEKGAASDAFKRACYKWGFGRFLYDKEKLPSRYSKKAQQKVFVPKTETKKMVPKTKEVVLKAIMAYEDKFADKIVEALNWLGAEGYPTFDDAPIEKLNTILKRFQQLEREQKKILTSGFSK